jgi:hypothetical protein
MLYLDIINLFLSLLQLLSRDNNGNWLFELNAWMMTLLYYCFLDC